MLNEDPLPGEIGIERMAGQFQQLAQRSARRRDDLGTAMEDPAALRTLIESNPIKAWAGGKGTGGVPYFSYEKGVFRTTKALPDRLRPSLQELVREIVDWRLAEYLRRSADGTSDQFVCKVSHANKRPILFLPNREHNPGLPMGTTPVSIDGELYEAEFVKVALNVVRRTGTRTSCPPSSAAGSVPGPALLAPISVSRWSAKGTATYSCRSAKRRRLHRRKSRGLHARGVETCTSSGNSISPAAHRVPARMRLIFSPGTRSK